MMEPLGAWQQIIEQGPLFGFMALVIFFGGKYINSTVQDGRKREDALEERYAALIDVTIKTQSEQTKAVTQALSAATEVMRRVEAKL